MTHRITPYPHELRRFQEAGSVLIVREVEPQPDVPPGVSREPYFSDATGELYIPSIIARYHHTRDCPFPPPGEEVWFCNCDHLRCGDCGRVIPDTVDYSCCDCGFPVDLMFPDNFRGVVVSRECRRVGTISHYESIDTGAEPDWDEFDSRTFDKEGWDEPEDFIEECENEMDFVNYGRNLVHSKEHIEWQRDRDAYARWLGFLRHWNATSKTPFDADPWAWVVRIEKNPENR